MDESCLTHGCVMSHIWMSHGTNMNESCQLWGTYEWFMSHIWMSHVTHINETGLTYVWVMSHIWMSHGTNIKTTYEWQLSSKYAILMFVPWLIHMWDMTPPCVRHDSSICETWLIHTRDMTHPYVRHDTSIYLRLGEVKLSKQSEPLRWKLGVEPYPKNKLKNQNKLKEGKLKENPKNIKIHGH